MEKVKKINVLIAALAVIVIMVCVSLLMRIDDRVILHVDNFEMIKSPEAPITVGQESEICFNKIPHDYLEIYVCQDSIRWRVNERYQNTDSLYYYKINDINPNKHQLSKGDNIVVSTDSGSVSINLEEITMMLKDVENEYVLLRNLLEKKQMEQNSSSLSRYNFVQDRSLKSFVYRQKDGRRYGDPVLVILDAKTTLHKNNSEIGYAMSGVSTEYEGKAKIQFFSMTASAYRPDSTKADDKNFAIKDVRYVAKPVIVTTEWGAGHVLLERDTDMVKCYFQKPVTYVERLEELRRASEQCSGMLTYHQSDGGFPSSSTLIMPEFSSYASYDICNLRFTGDSVLCDDMVMSQSKHFIPTLAKMQVGVNKEIGIRIGFLDSSFLWSCLWLPLCILLWCLITYVLISCGRIKKDNTSSKLLGRSQAAFPYYLTTVLLLLFAYLVCRVMIAVKLGFTYPYFENIFGVNVVSISLLLLLVYGLSGLLNKRFLVNKDPKWLAVGLPLFHLIGLSVCCLAFNKMNVNYSDSILHSYLPGDVITDVFNPFSWGGIWTWTDMNGMKDLFLNIPYTLLLANIIVCMITFFGIIFNGPIEKISEKIKMWFDKFGNHWLAPVLGYTVLGCLLMLIGLLMPGNFVSAYITFIVVVFMCAACRNVELGEKMNFWCAMLIYMSISIIFMVFAMLGGHDNGYITNAIGFILFVFFTYMVTEKRYMPNSRKEFASIVGGFLLISVVCFGIMLSIAHTLDTNRSVRRVNMVVNWEEYANSGYRFADSDAEFMRVMRHYLFNNEGQDPLSNDTHILHPSISSGQAPVVLNDVSIQSCFFGAYGRWTYVVYFSSLILICWLVLSNVKWNKGTIGRWVYWRSLAMFMWVGTSLYLMLSYMGAVPFTGRLNPGFGVDSVGEALETAILMAFMLAASPYREEGENG